MDMQSVSHSPEGRRLPCHFSKLTPEWKPLESRISPALGLTLESCDTPGPSARAALQTPAAAGAGHLCKPNRTACERRAKCLQLSPKCCPPRVTGEPYPKRKHSPRSHGDGATQPLGEVFWSLPCQLTTQLSELLEKSLENKSLQCTLHHRNTANAKRHKG